MLLRSLQIADIRVAVRLYIIGATVLALMLGSSRSPTWGSAGTEALVHGLERRNGLQVLFHAPRFPVRLAEGTITGVAPSARAVERYVPMLVGEFGLYPPALITRVGLKQIILCEGLAFAGQLRAAIPDFEHRDLYLDVSRGSHNRDYQRKVVAHEFYHLIDFADDGMVYSDLKWSALNPLGFAYGAGGVNAQGDRRMSLHTGDTPGFVSLYAMTGVEEDKAELFAALLMDREFVRRRMRRDPILAAKVQRMKSILQQFCSELNERFWKGIGILADSPPNKP